MAALSFTLGVVVGWSFATHKTEPVLQAPCPSCHIEYPSNFTPGRPGCTLVGQVNPGWSIVIDGVSYEPSAGCFRRPIRCPASTTNLPPVRFRRMGTTDWVDQTLCVGAGCSTCPAP